MIDYSKDENNIVTLAIRREDTPMNVLDQAFMAAFESSLDQALQEPDLKGVVVTSARKEFIAGADLSMLQTIENVADSLRLTHELNRVFRKLETAGKPVVAAINGTCLGGGYELTLACHWRVALDDARIQIGLPEVTLGLLPGAGGTQRLPRLIGFEKALPLLLEGKKLNPTKALAAGMVDALATSPEDLMAQAKAWVMNPTRAKQPWDEDKFKLPGGDVQGPRGYQVFPAATAMLRQKTWNHYPAPQAILSCVYQGLQVPFDQALAIESNYFAQLVLSPEAKGMIRTLFFGMNACNKGIARPREVARKSVQKLGVLGAGMMGSGIAYVSALAGIDVVLKDISLEVAEKGKSYSTKLLEKQVKQGRLTPEAAQAVLAKIHTTVNAADVSGCDLVIETVIEDRGIKAKVTQESEAVLAETAIMASNTSTLPITSLAKNSARPANFIGIHFFSPVDKMPLVEIIKGEQTSAEALALAVDYTLQLKKTPIVVNDGWGFYTSRAFMTYVEEGLFCVGEGIAPALIENAGKSVGMPVGPLAVMDEVSHDLVLHIVNQAQADNGPEAVDVRLNEIANLFVKQLARLGRKSGGGFYEYPQHGAKYLWPGLVEYFPVKAEQPHMAEIGDRLLYRQILETVRCFAENILTTARDGDVGAILGLGFPPFTGGPFSYIDAKGLPAFIARCQELEASYGNRFAVPQLLHDMAAAGKTFY